MSGKQGTTRARLADGYARDTAAHHSRPVYCRSGIHHNTTNPTRLSHLDRITKAPLSCFCLRGNQNCLLLRGGIAPPPAATIAKALVRGACAVLSHLPVSS